MRFWRFCGANGVGINCDPYVLKGEEGIYGGRYKKWDTGCDSAFICDDEYTQLQSWLYDKFRKSGVEFSGREVSLGHFPNDTCPGLPYTQYGIKTKGRVCDLYSLDELRDAGELQIISRDFPLYEFAKMEPTKRGKAVRTIMCYPLHVHVALLHYLLAFSECCKTLKQCKIGWSKWRFGVHRLLESMDGLWKFETDARQFDSTLPNFLVQLALETYFSLWPDIDPCLVQAIIDSIVRGLVFSSNGEVYFKNGGNPSGNPITTELNTVVHLLLWLLAWVRKHGTVDGFDDMMLNLYGDDVFGSSDGELLPHELTDLLHDMPVKYPVESTIEQQCPEGLTFLGCTFYRAGGFWLWRPAKPKKMLAHMAYTEKNDYEPDLNLELARVRGLLLDCAWDREMWNLFYKYQLCLEGDGASETDVGVHVDRRFVHQLTFGLQGGNSHGKEEVKQEEEWKW